LKTFFELNEIITREELEMNHPECTSCQYKAIADGRNGEWCYMFYNEPVYTCMIPERDERRKDRIQKAERDEVDMLNGLLNFFPWK